MTVFDTMQAGDHEQVVFCTDRASGLKAIIAIHDTTLGPSLGGIRMRAYETDDEALHDAVRLAQAMTYKAALAGLDYGGGKAVVIGDHRSTQREALFRSLGRAVESLAGRYIPTEDMGTTTADIEAVRKETSYGVGRDELLGGGGDPSPMTAWGVYCGLRACLQEVDGSDEFRGRTVVIQGLGKVGYALARNFRDAGAQLVVADIDSARVRRAETELGARAVEPQEVLAETCDILAPCAAGGVLNPESIPRLRCRIVGGGANNQLQSAADGDALQARGLLYAPDFAINAGGLINVADELGPGGYRRERAKAKTEAIYATLKSLFALSRQRDVPPHRLAVEQAKDRIASVRGLRHLSGVRKTKLA